MIYIITGANGSAKTAITLKEVRAIQVAEGRPVCHNGRSRIKADGELANWKEIDFKNWQDEPDGTIFFIDEAQDDLPTRNSSSAAPAYVSMLAKHRHRGFDFYLLTPHPKLVDSFVRGLIGAPSWHRHNKRVFGSDLVSVAQYPSVNMQCEAMGAGAKGDIKMVPIPKEVYPWYESASLHTAKRKIPWRVWFLIVVPFFVLAMGYFAFTKTMNNVTKRANPAGVPGTYAPGEGPTQAAPRKVMTKGEYIDQRVARIEGFPHTAPAYDEVVKPAVAPYPAACITMGDRCDCYTQQATLMQVPKPTCLSIVKRGYFVDWQQPQQAQQQAKATQATPPQQPASQARSVPVPAAPPPPDPTQMTQADLTAGLRLKNPAYAKLGGGGL